MGWSTVGLMGWSAVGLMGLIWELDGGGWVDRRWVWWVDRNSVVVDGLIDGGFDGLISSGFDGFHMDLMGWSVWIFSYGFDQFNLRFFHVLPKRILPKRFWFHCFARFAGFQIAGFAGKNTKNKFFQKKNNEKKRNSTRMLVHGLKNYWSGALRKKQLRVLGVSSQHLFCLL